jgi:hypothetical protein
LRQTVQRSAATPRRKFEKPKNILPPEQLAPAEVFYPGGARRGFYALIILKICLNIAKKSGFCKQALKLQIL